ncbi:hypothetical protein N7520_007113 [Penicillium odoratum]|uniref:uncharacterized protein n=1 Tax=Penicillium odoratum TaxID=1167516 RepID=UPI002548B10E|nr:uncharacterized protein N7520_007113 [Penicillium odoratum]KAJ5759957.1 hypothetical protein N7520_007113 [Penicillium odoratum]
MTSSAVCSDFQPLKVLKGAEHWIPQGTPDELVQTIIELSKGPNVAILALMSLRHVVKTSENVLTK